KSGGPYVEHAEEAAVIVAELGLDTATVIGALLHDVLEETDTTLEELREQFGDEIAGLVDGVTKIAGLRFESRESEQAENFRKMLLSVIRDARVLLIKLADRLHNMRTIEHLTPAQIERISRETRDIYAPLAGRFGMARIQRELEDLAFKWLEPEEYRGLAKLVQETRDERAASIEELTEPLAMRIEAEGVHAPISGRIKHLMSIHRKMRVRKKRFDEIYDLVAVRIITETVEECYRVFGLVHTLFKPVHERIKDYIATPKLNGYRALHTTVVGPHGRMFEIQIRTRAMHEQAEFGIAAHWEYKGGERGDEDLNRSLAWVRQLIEGSIDVTEAHEFLETLKIDLYQDEIFVFTPNGDLKQLARGSTPIDFAYAVHTGVGDSCAGARVNGRLVSLKHELSSGDRVEIITSDSARPNRDWLSIVATSRARSKVRHYLREQVDNESLVLGRRIVDREVKKLGTKGKQLALDDIAQMFGLDGTQELAAAVGRGDITVGELGRKLRPEQGKARELVERLTRRARKVDTGIKIDGVGDLMTHFAKCCQPVPGDRIIGIITRGRGISIHRVDCPNTFGPTIDDEHTITVAWDVGEGQMFPAAFVVKGDMSPGFLADVSRAIVDQDIEVSAASMTSENGQAVARFRVHVGNLHRLKKLIKTISSLKGVNRVERRRPVRER
ncbi:bifunctional (p)ppGpp synthetase/guanosine-3',5'-bis(diphosphate) 3'-pyrophosphohydrolase, partial [bacterium]|nr:bifunctional (p)ppGpp synthetase/guanosine-3',5'-bis(diphosphate) 3'-pyrophosphohydrolase [bacterium]